MAARDRVAKSAEGRSSQSSVLTTFFSPRKARDLYAARGPFEVAAWENHYAEGRDDAPRRLFKLPLFFKELPALPRVEGRKALEAEEHPGVNLKLPAHELRSALHRGV